MILNLLENALTEFFLISLTSCLELSSLNPECFVAKCLTRFRDNRRYPKQSTLRLRRYGNICCLETNQNIKFDHRLKTSCSMMEIEASLSCEILI